MSHLLQNSHDDYAAHSVCWPQQREAQGGMPDTASVWRAPWHRMHIFTGRENLPNQCANKCTCCTCARLGVLMSRGDECDCELNSKFGCSQVLQALCGILSSSPEQQLRSSAAVYIRQLLTIGQKTWSECSAPLQAEGMAVRVNGNFAARDNSHLHSQEPAADTLPARGRFSR